MLAVCRRAIFVLISAVAIIAPSAGASVKKTHTHASSDAVTPVAFPQEHSTFKADPDQIYGRLPNGMTYVIQKNGTPRGTAVVYLRIAAGSMMETEQQRGLAHFVEHMAFQGSTHIARGELKRTLERHGFAFGADVNAFTSEDKTIYTLSAPKSDPETLGTALDIMREVAGNLTFDETALDTERGVVLSEERVRDNPATHRARLFNRWLYPDQRYGGYFDPIGSPDILRSAEPAQLQAFYHAWYRPQLATIIVVGDIDPTQIEAGIKARFATWKAAGPMPQTPDWGHYRPRSQADGVPVFDYSETGLPRELALTWVRPLDPRPDGVAKATERAQDGLLIMLVNRRLQGRLEEKTTHLIAASFAPYDSFKTSRNLYLAIRPKPGQEKDAIAEAYGVLRTFRAHGVTAEEAALLASTLPAIRQNAAKGYATRNDGDIAELIVEGLDRDTVVLGRDATLAQMDALIPNVTRDALNARLKVMFDGDGPLLSDQAATPADLAQFGAADMRTAFAAADKAEAGTYAEEAKKDWPYTDFGGLKTPVAHTTDADFGSERFVFANGVVLNVKHTDFAANQVRVDVTFPGGVKHFDPKTKLPLAVAQIDLFTSGGLGKLDAGEIAAALPDKVVGARYAMQDGHAALSGDTTPANLSTELQLLMAFAVDPGLRAQGFTRFQNAVPEYMKTTQASPSMVLSYQMTSVLTPDDARHDTHILDHIGDVQWADLAEVYSESLGTGPVSVTIVGDVDVKAAVAEVGKTFANLEPRPAANIYFPGAEKMDFPPRGHDFTFTHQGRADQNISVVIWPTTGFLNDTKDSRGLEVLADIVKNRLFDELRQKQGADYSPTAESNMDWDFPAYGYLQIEAEIKAGDDGLFREAVGRIVADLKANPVGADELKRVKQPEIDALINKRNTNAYWLETLADAEVNPARRPVLITRRDEYEAVTADDVQRLARKWLNDEAAIHVKVIPQAVAKP